MDPLAQGAGGPRQPWLERRKTQVTGLSTSKQVKSISFSQDGVGVGVGVGRCVLSQQTKCSQERLGLSDPHP